MSQFAHNNTPLTPHDIGTHDHYWNAFGNSETEVSACWIIMFLQARNEGWTPFTRDAIDAFYRERRLAVVNAKRSEASQLSLRDFHEHITLNQLNNPKWLIETPKGLMVTIAFVARCYGSCPAKT
jgi:hypothetical protein